MLSRLLRTSFFRVAISSKRVAASVSFGVRGFAHQTKNPKKQHAEADESNAPVFVAGDERINVEGDDRERPGDQRAV